MHKRYNDDGPSAKRQKTGLNGGNGATLNGGGIGAGTPSTGTNAELTNKAKALGMSNNQYKTLLRQQKGSLKGGGKHKDRLNNGANSNPTDASNAGKGGGGQIKNNGAPNLAANSQNNNNGGVTPA